MGNHVFVYPAIGLGRGPTPIALVPTVLAAEESNLLLRMLCPYQIGSCSRMEDQRQHASSTPASGDPWLPAASLLGRTNETIQGVGGMLLENKTS